MFLFAIISYHSIEQPLRNRRWSASGIRDIAIGLSVSTFVASFLYLGMKNSNDNLVKWGADKRKIIHSGIPFADRCVIRKNDTVSASTFNDCTVPPKEPSLPTIWAQGDSHTGHLQGMLYRQNDNFGLGVHMVETPGVSFPFGEGRQHTARTTIDSAIRQSMKPGDIMLISRLFLTLSYPLKPHEQLDTWAAQVAELGRKLDTQGVALVIVGPPPTFKFEDVRQCLGRDRDLCGVPRREMAVAIQAVESKLAALDSADNNIFFFDTFSRLCPASEDICYPFLGKDFLYRDASHLNLRGSNTLAGSFSDFLASNALKP